jgi:hypothetical protein
MLAEQITQIGEELTIFHVVGLSAELTRQLFEKADRQALDKKT